MATMKEKQRLRMLHKQLKVGILQWDDVPPEDRMLLVRYYGWTYDGGWGG